MSSYPAAYPVARAAAYKVGRPLLGGASKSFIILNGATLSLSRAAYLNAITGVARMPVLHIGDSTTRGFQATGMTAANAYTGQLLSLPLSIPQVNTSMLGGNNGDMRNSFDPRFNIISGNTISLPALGGLTWDPASVATPPFFSFQPTTPVDTVDVYYISAASASNGNIVVQAYQNATPGAVLGTLSCNQPNAFRKATFSFSSAAVNNVQFTGDGSGLQTFAQGMDLYNSAAKGISHINAGVSSTVAADGANTSAAWAPLNGIGVVAAKLVFINYCINDAFFGTSLPAYQASMLAIINAVRTAGGDPVLLTGNPVDPTHTPTVTQIAVVNSAKALAATNNVPVIDTYSFFGTYAAMQAQGYAGTDLVHPSTGGYGQIARLVNLFISNYVANSAVTVTTAFDPARKDTSITLSGGNLTATGSVASFANALATVSKSAGKFYREVTIGASNGTDLIGMANSSIATTAYLGQDSNAIGWVKDGRVLIAANLLVTIATWATGNVLSEAVDLGNQKVWFRVGNGGWNNDILANQNPATNTGGISFSTPFPVAGPYFPAVCADAAGTQFTVNFGATAYAQSVPSGFGNWQ